MNRKTLIAIGNDIVDLQLYDNQPFNKHKRFINRTFHPNELAFLSLSGNDIRMMWSIWCAKEAAFKAVQKICPDIIFSPIKFYLTLTSLHYLMSDASERIQFGNIYCQEARLYIPIKWDMQLDNYIHCIATINTIDQSACIDEIRSFIVPRNTRLDIKEMTRVMSNCELKTINSLESLESRYHLKKILSSQEKIEVLRDLIKTKNGVRTGPPYLYKSNQPLTDQISISHDGKWIAIILFKPKERM